MNILPCEEYVVGGGLSCSDTPTHGGPLHLAEVLVRRGTRDVELVQRDKQVRRTVLVESDTVDWRCVESVQVWLPYLRTPNGYQEINDNR